MNEKICVTSKQISHSIKFVYKTELGLLTDRDVTKPKEATCEHLSMVHTKHFLENINVCIVCFHCHVICD